MATPSQNGAKDSAINNNTTPQSRGTRDDSHLFPHAHGLYFRNEEENDIFADWLQLPHPDIEISSFLAELPNLDPEDYEDGVLVVEERLKAGKMQEQDYKFKLLAQELDIVAVEAKLMAFKEELLEIQAMLEARLEDENADFNPWHFNQFEKEDQRAV